MGPPGLGSGVELGAPARPGGGRRRSVDGSPPRSYRMPAEDGLGWSRSSTPPHHGNPSRPPRLRRRSGRPGAAGRGVPAARRGGVQAAGRRRARHHRRRRRPALGHLVARLHRARHLLDAGPPGDLSRRAAVRAVRRLAGALDHLRRHRRAARHGRGLLGLPGAAGGLGGDLGQHRHAHLGAVRQLVARGLRSRRQDHLAAAPAARRRRPGDATRRHAAGAGGAEPPGRAAWAGRRAGGSRRDGRRGRLSAGLDLCLYRRAAADARLDDVPRVQRAEQAARCAVLRDLLRRLPADPGGGGARLAPALAGHDRGGDLHGRAPGDELAAAALPGHPEAGADLQPGPPPVASVLPRAADRAGGRARPAAAARRPAGRGARSPGRRRPPGPPRGAGPGAVPGGGHGLLRSPPRRAVELLRAAAEPVRAQLVLRRRPVDLSRPPRRLALPVLARGRCLRPARRGAVAAPRGRLLPPRPRLGRLAVAGPPVKRPRLPGTLALLAAALVSWGHVGSPNVFFEGAAGPYPVHVVVRPPAVIPGEAEIAVRVRAPRPDRPRLRVTAQPVQWDAGPEGAPPADVARPVRGQAGLFTARLWLMTANSYDIRVAVSGPAGSGTVAVPVSTAASRRLEMRSGMAVALLALAALLFAGLLSLVGAGVRESVLTPGEPPRARDRRRARLAMAATAAVLAVLLVAGKSWWDRIDAAYRQRLFRP